MASKLVNGKRVLVGSKADPDSSNYKPRSSSTGTSRTVTLKDGTMLSGQDAADYGSTSTSDILARRTTSSTNLGGSTATGDAVARLRSSMQDSYVSTPTQVADTSTDPASGTNREDDYVPRLYTSESSIVQPQSRERIERDMARSAQKEINSLRDYERTLLDEQATINAREERSTQARNVLSGLAGSSEADMAVSATMEKGSKANERIRAGVEVQVQGILSQIRKDAIAEARAQRGDYTQSLQDEAARLQLANANLTNLAAAGVTFDGLRTKSPREFEHLARQFGGTEALRGAFILNTPQDQILDKQIKGGAYVIAKQNPITGKVTVETVDLGLPPEYTKTLDAGDRILAVPDNWDGDPSKLVSIPKGLAPSAGGGGGGSSDTYANDLDAIIGATLSTIPSKFGQATFQSQINRARNDSDKINLIAAQILKGQPSEVKNDFRNQAVGIAELDKAIALIDSGVRTGALESVGQYTFNVFGRDFDPKLAQVNAHIISAIQPYRNSITGAAWGTQEDGEYQQLFGSTKYSPTELRQRLVTVKDTLKNKSAQGLNVFVNPMGYYGNPFGDGLYAPSDTGDVRMRAEAAGYDYDAMKRDGLTDEEISASL